MLNCGLHAEAELINLPSYKSTPIRKIFLVIKPTICNPLFPSSIYFNYTLNLIKLPALLY